MIIMRVNGYNLCKLLRLKGFTKDYTCVSLFLLTQNPREPREQRRSCFPGGRDLLTLSPVHHSDTSVSITGVREPTSGEGVFALNVFRCPVTQQSEKMQMAGFMCL